MLTAPVNQNPNFNQFESFTFLSRPPFV